MKRGGKEGEKGRNRDGGREGEKERERRGWTGWWRTAGRSSPFSLRQDTQVLSPIVFRCRLLHASLHRPATTPLRLHRQLVRKLSALVPGLFMPRWTTRQDAIRFARRLRAPCLGGSMVRELLKRNYRLLGKIPRGGWGIYRCLVDTVITDPISRGWKQNEEGKGPAVSPLSESIAFSKRGIFRGNGSTELCLLNFYFTRKTIGVTDPCPVDDQFPTIFKIQLAIASMKNHLARE